MLTPRRFDDLRVSEKPTQAKKPCSADWQNLFSHLCLMQENAQSGPAAATIRHCPLLPLARAGHGERARSGQSRAGVRGAMGVSTSDPASRSTCAVLRRIGLATTMARCHRTADSEIYLHVREVLVAGAASRQGQLRRVGRADRQLGRGGYHTRVSALGFADRNSVFGPIARSYLRPVLRSADTVGSGARIAHRNRSRR